MRSIFKYLTFIAVIATSCVKGPDNGSLEEDSEGAIVEVYENHIDIRGINFKAGRYLPIAVYRLETEVQTRR